MVTEWGGQIGFMLGRLNYGVIPFNHSLQVTGEIVQVLQVYHLTGNGNMVNFERWKYFYVWRALYS